MSRDCPVYSMVSQAGSRDGRRSWRGGRLAASKLLRGWTSDFTERFWPQNLVGNTPLVVMAWISSLPLGIMVAVLGGVIYFRCGMREV